MVDLQEEFLPDFHRTVRRLTGTAVRAVDAEGRFEFRSRWYADRVARVSRWTLVLLAVCLLLTVVFSIFFNAIEQGRLAIMSGDSPAALMTPKALASCFFLLRKRFCRSWSSSRSTSGRSVLAALVRGLRWPQLVRPLALTLTAFAFRPVYLLTGLVAAAIFSRGWSGLVYYAAPILDPSNLSILLFGVFLGRAAWRADREFRRLLPGAARKASPHRALVGGLTMAVSVTYAAVLACFFIYAGYADASRFRLPTAVNRNAAAAQLQLQAGSRLIVSDPNEGRGPPPQGDRALGGVGSRGPVRARLPDRPRGHSRQPRGYIDSSGPHQGRNGGTQGSFRAIRSAGGQPATPDEASSRQRAPRLHARRRIGPAGGARLCPPQGARCRGRGGRLPPGTGVRPGVAERAVAPPALRALRDKNAAAAHNGLAWLFAVAPARARNGFARV